jgi:dTDP-4-dehydrorhamnose 3,5-epimerase
MRPLRVRDAWATTLQPHEDERGTFVEWYQRGPLEAAIGTGLALAQANLSVSRRGVIRGVHFVDVPPGQGKWVSCLAGRILDVVVDVRPGSPTYGMHDSLVLGEGEWQAVYMAEGLGHAFMALTDKAVVTYLCSASYVASRERAVDPLDPALALPWPTDIEWVVSAKDRTAPTLHEAEQVGILPAYDMCRSIGAAAADWPLAAAAGGTDS